MAETAGSPLEGAPDRFWAKVRKASGDSCWEWQGATSGNGYGQFFDGKRKVGAHRFSYLLSKGQIPRGRLIMHLCDRRRCVRPDHLRAGTTRDNARDRFARARVGALAKIHEKLFEALNLATRRRKRADRLLQRATERVSLAAGDEESARRMLNSHVKRMLEQQRLPT